MDYLGLTQAELADALGISIDRAKSLSSGRVKKWAPHEIERLIELGFSAHWLGTGYGAMLQSDVEKALNKRLKAVKHTSDFVTELALPPEKKMFLRDILYAAEVGDCGLIAELMADYAVLRTEEKKLLDNLKHCSPEDQNAIKRLAETAAKANPEDENNNPKGES